MKWLIFDQPGKFEYGYKPFNINRESAKLNKGKKIVYVRNQDIDRHRGYAFPRYAVIHGSHYSQLLIDNGNDSVDMRDIIECGIEI